MPTPSFMHSTLSLMALMALLTVIFCIVFGIEIKGELLAVLTSIIGAYTGARNPNALGENNVQMQVKTESIQGQNTQSIQSSLSSQDTPIETLKSKQKQSTKK